jgi:hypothetical protein
VHIKWEYQKITLTFLAALSLLASKSYAVETDGKTGLKLETTSSTMALPTAPINKSAVPADTNSKLTLSPGVRAKSVEDNIVNAKMAGAVIGITGERTFTPSLSGKIDISLLLLTGNYSNRYTSEGAAPNGLDLGEASLTGKLFSRGSESVYITGGVIPVEFTTLISVLDGVGFPGLKETAESSGETLKAQIWASQTTPTSDTGAVKSSESGVNSQLQMAGLNIATNPKGTDDYTFKLGASQFDFQNLTSSAATDSQYRGNSVTQIGNQAKFKYQFKGYEAAASAAVKVGLHWNFETVGSYLVNSRAPSGLNKGSMGQLKTSYLDNGIKYTGTYASFYNEPDTLPATYTLLGIGQNNRFGWYVSFKTEWEKEKVNSVLKFVQANEMQDNIYTADRQIISLSVEAVYDIF